MSALVSGRRSLPPATKLRQGNVFTPVCHSVHGGGGQTPLLGRHPLTAQCMLEYDQQAGGTRPTGMHSCSFSYCFCLKYLEMLSCKGNNKVTFVIYFLSNKKIERSGGPLDEIHDFSLTFAVFFSNFPVFFLVFCFLYCFTENLIHFSKQYTVHLNIPKNNI